MIACAIYTRKSSEEGLEQSFNSLDAQREACEAFIQSQKALGWKALPNAYDDGGFSGGNTQRPALQQLLSDIEAHKVKIIVVYKVDRLTRSLADFAKLVELFDARGVSFVSVTQQFNTTSSMGRLTLNVLLSFAQFEREVTGERIRDKIAASKRKGLWMGGMPPIGYTPKDRTLVIDEVEAERIREIFRLYLKLRDVSALKIALDDRGWKTPVRQSRRLNGSGGRPFSRGHLYRILGNAIYRGRIVHREQTYPGSHPAIVDEDLWNAVQAQLASNRHGERSPTLCAPSLLAGLVFDEAGNRMSPTHAKKGSRRYRYYATTVDQPLRLPAQELEDAVMREVVRELGNELTLEKLCDDANHLRRIFSAASALREELTAKSYQGKAEALRKIVSRIQVGEHTVNMSLKSEALGADDQAWEIGAALQLRRCGTAIRLISVDRPQRREADPKLISLITRAQDWFGQLAAGRAPSLETIAKDNHVTSSYVARVMRLAFLAPNIVQAIVAGEQPPELSTDKLMRLESLPRDWQTQRVMLGF